MKYVFLIISIAFSSSVFGQKEGQIFCEGNSDESYFTLLNATKYIVWGETYYSEEKIGEKILDGKTYTEYKQIWETGDSNSLFLREENGVMYQFETCCEEDTIRLPKNIEKGLKWKTADGLSEYEIISLDTDLKTPVCTYKKLLVIKGTFENGEFLFYYLKGFGYVGASVNDTLISFTTPDLPKRK